MKRIIIILIVVSTILFPACQGFLDRTPQDAMSDATFFTLTSDLKNYMNGLYSAIIRTQSGNKWIALEDGTDNLVGATPATRLMQHSATGLVPATDANWNGTFDNIRKANYLLVNSYKVPNSAATKHYRGEGFFSRAWFYFSLLKSYGGVPYIDKVLNIDSPELYKPREARDFIAGKIIQDLDSAIANLNWKGAGEAVSGRINKESALVLKSTVGLYEGSWELYHGKKGTPFAVSGKNGSTFLQAAVAAGDQLIAYQGSKIYKGSTGKEYQDYFNQKDYSTINGAFLYKAYSRSLGIIELWYRPSVEGVDCGLTKSCVDAYLMKDGKPAGVSTIVLDDTKMDFLVRDKDPRLGQTIYNPAKGQFATFWNYIHAYKSRYPGLIQTQQRQPSYSGYRVWKGILFDDTEVDNGETDDLIIRYEEALLNYAEAKAILGIISQVDLDKTINILRGRVGMAAMSIADINSWNYVYTKQNGYEPSENKIVNEIRRERRVELVLEGSRYDDLKRWTLLDDVFNGVKPVGARLQEFMDYWNNGKNLRNVEGFTYSDTTSVKLIKGTNVDVIGASINPFFKNTDFKATSGRGYYISPLRDYLSPIPGQEIILYQTKGGVKLEQNPGWF